MKIRQIILLSATALAMTGRADEDVPIAFRRIEYTFNTSNSVTVKVENLVDSIHSPPLRLTAVELVWDGQTIAAPTNVLAEMLFPRLSSIDIQAGAYYGDVNGNAPYRHLSVEVCDPRPDADNMLDKYRRLQVQFLFWGGCLREIDVGAPRGARRDVPFFFGTTVWHVDRGFSWNGVQYPSLASVLDALDA